MTNEQIIRNYLRTRNFDEILPLHNEYCNRNHYCDSLVFPMDNEHIEMFYGTAVHLFIAIKESSCFDRKAKYFYIKNAEIRTDIYEVIDFSALAEYLIRWGDCGYKFEKLDEYLINGFIEYATPIVKGRYSEKEIRNIVEESNADFLMDEWEDILKDTFNVIAICQECGETIYNDSPSEYIYDTGRTLYNCPNELCDGTYYA